MQIHQIGVACMPLVAEIADKMPEVALVGALGLVTAASGLLVARIRR